MSETTRPSNRLLGEKSPYLLQHAHNPVDWRPWGAEAFADAKRRNVPIFLSKLGRLATTQDETRAAVLEVLRTRRCSQLVIETYTWPLLEREERLVKGIVKEFRWLEGVIEGAGAGQARRKGRSPPSAFPLAQS